MMVPLFINAFRWKGLLATLLLFAYPVIAYYLLAGGCVWSGRG